MEARNLKEYLKSEDEKLNFGDIPDYIIDIKEEILDQDISESICSSRDDEKCIPSSIMSEQQCNDNMSTLLLKPIKTENFVEVTNTDEYSVTQSIKNEDEEQEARITEEEENQQRDYMQSLTLNNSSYQETNIKKCDLCSYQTRRTSNYKRHLLSHNPKKDYVHKCLDCEFQTTDEYAIYKHMGQHSNYNNTESQKCQQCDIKTFEKRILPQHNLSIDPKSTKECYYQNCRNSEKVHVFSHESIKEVTIYKCSECNYQTKRKGNLTHHSLRHKNADELYMFACDQCSYQSFNKCHLKTHLLTHMSSSEVQLFKCSQCGYHSKYKADLAVHILRHKNRSEVKMHKCTQCNYEAIRKCDLNRHLLRHKSANEVKMHNCPECEYKTFDKGNLNKHISRHKTVKKDIVLVVVN